jgi:thioredoxin-dependent peroxiredoxin
VNVGDLATDFDATDDGGRSVRLTQLLDQGPVVLFFYPAAFTPGCTAESCHFRDLSAEFSALGATVAGISTDGVAQQSRFSQTYRLGFPLLSDPRSKIARSFGADRPGLLPNARTTFVIDTDRRVLEVIRNEINMNVHADRALDALRRRSESRAVDAT